MRFLQFPEPVLDMTTTAAAASINGEAFQTAAFQWFRKQPQESGVWGFKTLPILVSRNLDEAGEIEVVIQVDDEFGGRFSKRATIYYTP